MSGWQWTLRNFLVVSVKTAVGALIVEAGAWFILPANFNLHDKAAIWNMGKLALFVIGGSEAKVWVPKMLAWSQTPTDLVQAKLGEAQVATKGAVVAAKQAEAAVADAKSAVPPHNGK